MLEFLANLIGVLSAFYATYRYIESKRVKPIPVTIKCVNTANTIASFSIPKSQFSRAEVIGRLAMLAKVARMNVAALGKSETIAAIDAVTMGKANKLVINVTEEEATQF